MYEQIQKDLDSYMENDYADDKVAFEEEKEYQKDIKKLANKILKSIKDSNGIILQKELKKQLSEDELFYFNRVVKSLLESGKIVKFKDGKFVGYKISQSNS